MEFDPLDAGATLALAVSGFIMTGIATFQLFDVNFSDVIYSSGNIEITMAYALSVAALGATFVTNESVTIDGTTLKSDETGETLQDLGDYYYYAVVATLGLMAAWLVLPQVPDFFTSSDLWALVYVGVTTTGQFVIGWML
jgi:hypothetical protein